MKWQGCQSKKTTCKSYRLDPTWHTSSRVECKFELVCV